MKFFRMSVLGALIREHPRNSLLDKCFGSIYYLSMFAIRRIWKKVICAVCAVLGIGTLVSCYGMPMNGYYTCVHGKVTDSEDNPVQGIQVTVQSVFRNNDNALTDEVGSYSVEVFALMGRSNIITLEFKDIDGAENGSFKTKSEKLDLNKSIELEKNIVLEEDNLF